MSEAEKAGLLEKVKQAVNWGHNLPPEKRFQMMVDAGLIDEQGNVLERPRMKDAAKKNGEN